MSVRMIAIPQLRAALFVLAGVLAYPHLVQAKDVMDWLTQAGQAARKLDYSGTFVYHHGGHMERRL